MHSHLCAVAVLLASLGGCPWPVPARAIDPAGPNAEKPATEEPGEPARMIIEAAPGLPPLGDPVRAENAKEPATPVPAENAKEPTVWEQVMKALEPGDARNFWLAVVVASVALATLVVLTYFGWQNTQQQYYIYLGNVWYKLKEQCFENPRWLDPDWTSLHVLRADLPLTKYDAHAWMSWALAEDCWATYKMKMWPRLARPRVVLALLIMILGPLILLRRWMLDKFYRQFEGTIRRTNELHRGWFDSQRGPRSRFGKDFIAWVDKTFLPRIKTYSTKGVINGKGVLACQKIAEDDLIGTLVGKITDTRGKYTLQIAKDTHLEVDKECKLRHLNHSFSPNAVVRGLNVYSCKKIAKGKEITLNYNATEYEIAFEITDTSTGLPVVGYSRLSNCEKKKLRRLLHGWIRCEEGKAAAAGPMIGRP